jgi:hypothetical protein
MGIYESLAPHYDDFFPQDPRATAFLLGLPGGGPGRARGGSPLAVDFGCATGSQVLDLAAAGWRAVGWEPCEPMLEIARFLGGLARIAAPGGSVVLQLLNYELVLGLLRAGEFGFPVLSAGGAAFERSYSIAPDGDLAFRTVLVEEGRRIVGENRLRPFPRGRVAALLESSGFGDIRARGDWDRDSFDPSSDRYLILTARRR